MPRRALLLAKLAAALFGGSLLSIAAAWAITLALAQRPMNFFNTSSDGARETPRLIPPHIRPGYLGFNYATQSGYGYRFERESTWPDEPNAGGGIHTFERLKFGFPFPCLRTDRSGFSPLNGYPGGPFPWSGLPIPRTMPWHDVNTFPLTPLLPGFALNTLFYATLLFTLFSTPRLIRRHFRRRRNHCPTCNYDLRGLPTPSACPECGP